MAKIGFTVDALNVIQQVFNESSATGIRLGLRLMYELLQKVAERAVELGDEKLLALMEKLHLVEKTEEGR